MAIPVFRKCPGYILLEAVMAMAVLSLGIVAIQQGIRQTLITRGLARDYTHARFLMDSITAQLELQPEHAEGGASGPFGPPYERFSWEYEVSKIEIPPPPIPPDLPPEELRELNVPHLAKVVVAIRWRRGTREFEHVGQTLFAPEQLYLPPENEFFDAGYPQGPPR